MQACLEASPKQRLVAICLSQLHRRVASRTGYSHSGNRAAMLACYAEWHGQELGHSDCLLQFLPASFLYSAGWLELSVCYLIPILSLLPGVWAAGKKHSPLSHAPQHILMN